MPSWTEPGAYLVVRGIHRIPLPLPQDGLKAVNVYVIETTGGLTCIDGGWAIETSRRVFEESLKTVGYHPRDITSFLVTHAHRDHYTQAAALRDEFRRATVTLGLGDKPILDHVQAGTAGRPILSRLRQCAAEHLAQQWAEDFSELQDRLLWSPPDAWLSRDSDVIVGDRPLRALATPGHTAGHFVFADESSGLLFAGDHILPTITPSVGFESNLQTEPLRDFLASLAKVRRMPDMRLLPAHGDTDMRTHERIDHLLAHHEDRLSLCLEAVTSGHHTAWDVARQLPWTGRNRSFDELDIFNSGLAVLETKAHLDLLAALAQLQCDRRDEIVYYTAITAEHPW